MRWIKLSEILIKTKKLHKPAHLFTTEIVSGDVESPEYKAEIREIGEGEESFVTVILPPDMGVEIWPGELPLTGEAPEEMYIVVPVRIPTVS